MSRTRRLALVGGLFLALLLTACTPTPAAGPAAFDQAATWDHSLWN